MDGEAVHDYAPRGGCGRHGPGPVGGDGARAPSTEGAVALRVAAGAATGSVHSAQRTAVSASHGGRALRRSDCPTSSPPRFAPASSACAAGMDSPCNSIFLGPRMAVMEWVRQAAVAGCAAGGRTMKGRGARETRSFGAAWPRPCRPVPAGSFSGGSGDGGRDAAIPVMLVGRGQWQQDVLVLAMDRQLSVAYSVEVGTKGLMLGQSVRFLGYFPRVRTSPLPGYKERGAPLVMGGVVSGFDFREGDSEGSSLWIDGHNNRGFSGGPVVFQPATAPSVEACRWRIAGVISGYVTAPVEVRTIAGGKTAALAISNAGLLRAVPIETVRGLAKKNPIGFPLDR